MCKCMIFLIILFICVENVYRVIVPKFFFSDIWPTTLTYSKFYEEEEDTIDVIFLGSSHAASSFIPQELYNNYGITSYNLGCEQQNLVTSYFWLKEALRYQKPKAVVLDCYFLFLYSGYEPLNSAESCTRKALDYMKWSLVKREAVKTICELDQYQSLVSYYLPNIRYHARWMNLSENDFFSEIDECVEYKGYTPLSEYAGLEGYEPFEADMSASDIDMVPLMETYLNKIVELCKNEGISFILTKTPTLNVNLEKYNTIKKYAEEHNIDYFDFNEKNLYEKVDFCFATDLRDADHLNLWGAKKITNYIGRVLSEQYDFQRCESFQWEALKDDYEKMQKDCELVHIVDIDKYMAALQDMRYSIFISVNEECTQNLRDHTIQQLRKLGLQASLQQEYGCSYCAVISDGTIIEQKGYNSLNYGGAIRDNLVTYDIKSAGNQSRSLSSILIEGTEYSKNERGMNIVVYNNDTRKVIDSVCFDTHERENFASR